MLTKAEERTLEAIARRENIRFCRVANALMDDLDEEGLRPHRVALAGVSILSSWECVFVVATVNGTSEPLASSELLDRIRKLTKLRRSDLVEQYGEELARCIVEIGYDRSLDGHHASVTPDEARQIMELDL
jgi:hypothetical protein